MSSPSPLATLVVEQLRLERGGRQVLDGLSLTVAPGTRLGVVGPNGAGKSTLLAALAGRLLPDAGRVERLPPEASVGLLDQEHERRPEKTASQLVARATGAEAADAELLASSAALAAGDAGAGERYAAALEAWSALGVDTLGTRTASVLAELGLAEGVLELPTAALSGGQRARLSLAAVLLGRFDVLLLDEPTNDLDFDGIARLEAFLAAREGATVVVSHDRAFLESLVTAVLELDPAQGAAQLYEGGFAAFTAERETARRHAEEAHGRFERRRGDLLERARREREWATTAVRRERRSPRDSDKLQRDFRVNRTERLAQRARRTERALERLEVVDKPFEGWELRFSIEEAERPGDVVARLEQAVVERGSFRLGPLDLELAWGERLLLSGPNGSGKTTLIEALLGTAPLASGRRHLGPSVVVGRLDQGRTGLGTGRLLDGFVERSGLDQAPARSLLAKFGLGASHALRPVGALSPGERTRAELALFQARGVNLLVLDEPTNHLDLPAIDQLERALAAYHGSLVLVSHDRRLLETVGIDAVLDLSALRPAGAPGRRPD